MHIIVPDTSRVPHLIYHRHIVTPRIRTLLETSFGLFTFSD